MRTSSMGCSDMSQEVHYSVGGNVLSGCLIIGSCILISHLTWSCLSVDGSALAGILLCVANR